MNKIAIIDDHQLFSSGLSLLLNELGSDVEISTFETVDSFLMSDETSYSVIILDFYLPGSDFTETISLLTSLCPVVVISASPSPLDSATATSSGAVAFLNKNAAPDTLLETITTVLNGDLPNPCHRQSQTHGSFSRFGLTPRQSDILLLISKGYSNKEVAAALTISPETVKTHLKSIFQRINVQNRIQAIEFMRQYGVM